jgi:hypothetical protein
VCECESEGGEKRKKESGQGVYRTEEKNKERLKSRTSTATTGLKALRLLPCLVKGIRDGSRLKRSFAALAESLRRRWGEREEG